MDGLILVRKPKGCTSHDVVDQIRALFCIKKVGHFGTLDPMATGLMLIGLGQATRLFPFLSKADKEYSGRIRLGFSTETYDAEGKPISSESNDYPEESFVSESLTQFEGKILQIAPPYSAKKHKGRPLYTLARETKDIPQKKTNVVIHYFRLVEYTPPFIGFKVKCSSGTYIRSLAHELGQVFGCGAHLCSLDRTSIGKFSVSESRSLEELKHLLAEGKTVQFLIPMAELIPEFPKIILNEKESSQARNGNDILVDSIQQMNQSDDTVPYPEIFRLFDPEDNLLAYAKINPNGRSIHPFLVLDDVKRDF